MQCHHCGTQTQEGVAFCQNCGTPISSPPLAPTVAAPQPLHTNYNSPSNDPANNPYGNPSNPYENPPNPYAPPPPPNNFPPYQQPGTAPAYPPGGYGVPVKRKSNVGLIVGIVIAVIIVAIVGVTLLSNLTKKTNLPKTTTTPIVTTDTSTPTTTSGSPSGTPVDSTAASIVTNLQMASDIDQDTAKPTTLTTSFTKGSYIYATYQYDFNSTDVSTNHPAYMETKWYKNNTLLHTSQVLSFDGTDPQGGVEGYAYFALQYLSSTNSGAVEIYWCQQSDCSDRKLAQYTTFTVR